VDVAAELTAAAQARAAGDLSTARTHLEAAAAADATLFDARLDLAELLLDGATDLGEAAAALREARALRAADARLDRLQGELDEVRGDLPGAVDAYARSLAVRPDSDIALRRAVLLRRLGRAAEAIAEFEQVRDARPRDRVARSNLAELYEERGRVPEAERELETLAQTAPGDPAPLRALAAFQRRRGDARRARRLEEEAARAEGGTRALRPLRPSR
jgi:tetratricopeptide (TPR) repeat protein